MKKKIALVLAAISAIMMLVMPVSASGAVTMPAPDTIVTSDTTSSFLGMIWGFVPVLLPIVLGLLGVGIVLKLIKRAVK